MIEKLAISESLNGLDTLASAIKIIHYVIMALTLTH